MSDSISSLSPATPLADMMPLVQQRLVALRQNGNPTRAEFKKVAQDFEALLIEKLMQEMQNTIPDFGMFSSAGMKQIKSMFWSFLSEQVAQNGGMGLGDDLYRDFCQAAGLDPTPDAASPARRPEEGRLLAAQRCGVTARHKTSASNGFVPLQRNVAKFLQPQSAPQSTMELKR